MTLQTGPSAEPVTLAEAKTFLRVDGTDDDALVTNLIKAARQGAEKFMRRALITQSWRLSLDRFPGKPLPWWDGVREGADISNPVRAIELPFPPLQQVVSLVTIDDADAETTFPAANYIVDVDREPGRIALKTSQSWPANLRPVDAVRITYQAGYGNNPTDVPQAIVEGIKLQIAALFDNRDSGEIPPGARALFKPYRITGL